MNKKDLIGSYAIIGFDYDTQLYSDQIIYVIIDFSQKLDSFKLRSLKPNEFESIIYEYHYRDGFWLKSKFIKVLGNPETNKLVKILYGS